MSTPTSIAAPQLAEPLARLSDLVNQWIQENGQRAISVPLVILLILALAIVLRFAAKRLIRRVVRRMIDNPLPVPSGYRKRGQRVLEAHQRIAQERRDQRARTVGSVLGSIASVVIFATAFIMILSQLGVSIGPILASAGIVGVAVGFGAQSLVSDFLAGMFMLMEDQYGVGDWIDVGSATGMVEEVGLRVTQLRDGNGVLWFVRNGEVTRVGNHSQDWARALLDIPIPYTGDVDRASELLEQTAWTLWEDEQYKYLVLEEPEIWGVEHLSREAIVIRLAVKTAPLEQWDVSRELRRRIKDAFDREGLHIPLPQQALWLGHGEPAVPTLTGDGNGAHHTGETSRPRSDFRGD